MTWGHDELGASIDEARKILDAYAEAGGNVIDTANRYGNGASERIVGVTPTAPTRVSISDVSEHDLRIARKVDAVARLDKAGAIDLGFSLDFLESTRRFAFGEAGSRILP